MVTLSVKPGSPPKLIVFVGNPTQYHAPIFKGLSARLMGQIEVLYGDSIGAKPFFSPELDSIIEWDVPVLEGYPYKIFYNLSPSSKKGFWSRNNPRLIPYVIKSPASYVLLHGYDTVSSWYVFFAALVSRKRILWRGEAVEKPNGERFLPGIIKRIVLPLYFSLCYRVLYSCSNNRDYLQNYLRDTSKFLSFPCAVDNEYFRAEAITDENIKLKVKKELNIPAADFIITTCSRLTKRKRTDLLLKAISQMSCQNVTLLVIGNGPERPELEKLACELGVKMVVVGFVGQRVVARYLSLSNAFALLSSYDASPKALNEALSFDLPLIVSSGVGTARDLVIDDANGYLITPSNLHLLPIWLDELVGKPDLAAQKGKYNKKIREYYSIENDIEAIVKVVRNDRS